MQILKIKSFIAVVISESFSDAAEMLYTTQASVSKHVLSLERELGVTLFDRSKRKVKLTESGHVFLHYAQILMDTYNEMNNALGELCNRQNMQTTVASIPVIAHYGIVSLISDFRERNPHINLIVDEREAFDIIGGLEDGQYEMAFMRERGLDQSKFQQLVLFCDRLAVLIPDDHPLAKFDEISIRQLKNETFLMLGKRTGLYDFFVDVCDRYGEFSPQIGYTGTHLETIIEMIEKHMGISLMMEIPAKYIRRNYTKVIRISEDIQSQLVLTRLQKCTPSRAGNMLWNFFRDWVNHQ